MIKVLVGIPQVKHTNIEFETSLNNVLLPSKDIVGVDYKCYVKRTCGDITDHARNVICAEAINDNFEYILFLDDDMIHPHNALHFLLSNKEDESIVGGLYVSHFGDRVHAYDYYDNTYWAKNTIKPNTGLIECSAIGTGCMLIPVKILKKLKFPWFEYRYTELPKGHKHKRFIKFDGKDYTRWSEDIAFCNKWRKAGYDIYVDTNVLCYHLTTMAIGINEDGQFSFNSIQEIY